MGNKIVTIVTSLLMMVALIVLVAFISTDEQIDESDRLVQEFTETARYKGYITYDQYMNLINSVPYNNFKVQITHFANNTDESYSPGTLNMRFTSQILGSTDALLGEDPRGYKIRTTNGNDIYSGRLLYNGNDPDTDPGIYKMQVGDQLQVDLVIMENTFFDAVVGTLTSEGVPSMKIISSASGVVLNEKYDDLT